MTNDVGAGFSESYCDRLAQACRRAGHEPNFSVEFELIENHCVYVTCRENRHVQE